MNKTVVIASAAAGAAVVGTAGVMYMRGNVNVKAPAIAKSSFSVSYEGDKPSSVFVDGKEANVDDKMYNAEKEVLIKVGPYKASIHNDCSLKGSKITGFKLN